MSHCDVLSQYFNYGLTWDDMLHAVVNIYIYIFFLVLSISVPEITFSLAFLDSFIWFWVACCFSFFFLLTALLLLYDADLFRHKYLGFQYLSCLDFTACMRFVKWSCFWVGHTWTLVCKCYLNLCSIIVCGMYVQTWMLYACPAGAPPSPSHEGSSTFMSGDEAALDSPLTLLWQWETWGREALPTLKMVLCPGGPAFLPPPLFFKNLEEDRSVTCMAGIYGLWCFVLYLV